MKQSGAFWKEETGSAILLSLGILSLVLILAMSFAFSANTQKAIAKTQGAATSARMVADEAVDLAIADMQWMFKATENNTHTTANAAIGIYPPETMNQDKAYAGATADSYNQDCFLFRRFKPTPGNDVSATNPYLMNYLVSTDVGRTGSDAPDYWEKHCVGQLFGLSAETSKTEDTYTSSDLTDDWQVSSDLEDKVNYLPQLQFLSGSLLGNLGFAPALTVTYKLWDEETPDTKTYTKATGRYAYILLDETGKFDINSVISLTGDIPTALDHTGETAVDQNRVLGGGMYCDRLAPAVEIKDGGDCEYDYGVLVDESYAAGSTTRYAEDKTFRMGLLPEEIQVDENYVDFMEHVTGGTKVKIPYESYNQLCESAHATKATKFVDTSSSPKAVDSEMFQYTFFGLEDIEAYWVPEDVNDDNKVEKYEGTEYQRFDLSGISWGNSEDKLFDQNASPVENAWEYGSNQEEWRELIWRLCGLDSDSKADADPGEEPLAFWKDRAKGERNYSVEQTHNDMDEYTGHLDWLHRMVDNDGKKVGVQVAANIKDFSDSDDYASTDFNFTESAPTGDKYAKPEAYHEPHYCGNERVSYINEIAVQADYKRTPPAGSTDPCHQSLTLNVGVEMLNIYCLGDAMGCKSDEICTIPLGDVHVKLMGRLHVWAQEYYIPEGKEDPEPVENGLKELTEKTDSKGCPFKETVEGDDRKFLSFSTSSNAKVNPHNVTPTLDSSKHHMGYSTIEMKLTVEDDKLFEIIDTKDFPDLKSTIDNMKNERLVENSNKMRYVIVYAVTVTKVVAYSCEEGAGTGKNGENEILNKLYDVACPLEDTSTGNEYKYTGSNKAYVAQLVEYARGTASGADDIPTIVSFQARDCRVNHRSAEKFWAVLKQDGDKGENTLGENNKDEKGKSVFDEAEFGKDPEDSTDMEGAISFKKSGDTGDSNQTTYSTAFIRNAPMLSLWELGAIHRGDLNQTINLKVYSDRKDTMKYTDGDAGILDQVKIGPLMFVKGKINANQRNYKVWEKLLNENLEYSWYDRAMCKDMNDTQVKDILGGDETSWKLASDDLKLLENGKAWKKDENEVIPTSYNRGAIANMLKNILSGPANDRDYESYIGKTAGLLTTRCEAYSLLLVAEALNDLTGEVADKDEWDAVKSTLVNPRTVKACIYNEDKKRYEYKDRYCTVTGRQKVLVHLVRDAWRNEITVHSKRYLGDE